MNILYYALLFGAQRDDTLEGLTVREATTEPDEDDLEATDIWPDDSSEVADVMANGISANGLRGGL